MNKTLLVICFSFLISSQVQGEVQSRIVGGDITSNLDYQFAVSLTANGSSGFCGGTLIADKWVLTAAHCFYGNASNQVVFAPGLSVMSQCPLNDISIDYLDCTQSAVKKIHFFNFNPATFVNDLALLELYSAVPSAKTVTLPSQSPPVGTLLLALGWGTTSEGGFTSDRLRKVLLPVVSQAVCQAGSPLSVTSKMLCAGYAAGGKDTCQGDSGGPLVQSEGGGDYSLSGITSFGAGCAVPGHYGVYTRVSSYKNAIENVINGNTGGGGGGGLFPWYLLLGFGIMSGLLLRGKRTDP